MGAFVVEKADIILRARVMTEANMTDEQFEEKMKEEFDDVSIGITKGDDRKIKKIVVDRPACIAARSCVLVAENAFQMDDENLAYVPADASKYEDDDTLLMAAQSCPVLAIHLYDKENKKVFPK